MERNTTIEVPEAQAAPFLAITGEQLEAEFRQLTGRIAAALVSREDMIDEMVRRNMPNIRDLRGLRMVCKQIAEELNVVPPEYPEGLVTRERDETGFWTNIKSMAVIVRVFLDAMMQDAKRWRYYASSPQTALMLGSTLDPNDHSVDWAAESSRLADQHIQ